MPKQKPSEFLIAYDAQGTAFYIAKDKIEVVQPIYNLDKSQIVGIQIKMVSGTPPYQFLRFRNNDPKNPCPSGMTIPAVEQFIREKINPTPLFEENANGEPKKDAVKSTADVTRDAKRNLELSKIKGVPINA